MHLSSGAGQGVIVVVAAVTLIATSRVPTTEEAQAAPTCATADLTLKTEISCEAPGELKVSIHEDCTVTATSSGAGLPPIGVTTPFREGFSLTDLPIDGGHRSCTVTRAFDDPGTYQLACSRFETTVCGGLLFAPDAGQFGSTRLMFCSSDRTAFDAVTTCGPATRVFVATNKATCEVVLNDANHLFPSKGQFLRSMSDLSEGFILSDEDGKRCHATPGRSGSMFLFCTQPCPDAGPDCRTSCGGTLTPVH